MKKKRQNLFVPATENYKIENGTYDFLVCKNENTEDNRTISIKSKFLKTALRKVMDIVDSYEEIIDYEVAVTDKKTTTFINLHSLKAEHPIHSYLS